VHGGCLMAFADYCMFAISNDVLVDDRGVTLSFTSEFIDAAYEDELIEGHGEVVRASRSILFLRGTRPAAGGRC
jgi:acyl-coenzyme A thioesterase PaaI-like protein